MGSLRLATFSLLVFLLATGASPNGRAQVPTERSDRVAAAGTVSMDQAVKMAEQRFRARVVRAETSREGVHTVYVLKLLNDAGHVWTVRVDATNGAIL